MLLVDDGVYLEMDWGGGGGGRLRGWAGVAMLIMLFLESLQPVHLLFSIYFVSIRLLYVIFIYFSFSLGKLA